MLDDAVTSHFESVASQYDEVLPFFTSFARDATPHIEFRPGARVLDLGSGRGAISRVALAHGCHVTAVDSSPTMIRLLRQDMPAVEAAVMDAQHPDLDDASFEVVVSAFVVHIVSDPQSLVANAVRVLRPGGLVALVVPGRADGAPDAWTDPVQDVVREFRAYQADGSGRHAGGDYESEEQLLTDHGLIDVTGATLEVSLPVPDGDTYWRWMNSHGAGTFAKSLPEARRTEFKERVTRAVDQAGGTVLRRSAAVWSGTRPS